MTELLARRMLLFERLIDYGRYKLANDTHDYTIKCLLQSDFIDSVNKATEAGKNMLDKMYHFQNLLFTLGSNWGVGSTATGVLWDQL